MKKESSNEEERKGVSVAYQNKDISSKYFASMHGSVFARVLGIDIAPLVRNEATELPMVEVSDMMMDNLFLLEDGTYAIIDYESKYSEDNKIKYLNYVARLVKSLYNQNKKIPKIHMVVIYTADVIEGTTDPVIDIGLSKVTITEIFLTNWNTEVILKKLERSVRDRGTLSEDEQIQLIMVSLTIKGKEAKLSVIRRCIDIIELVKSDKLQMKLYGGLIAFTDKIIEFDELEEARRKLEMTKIEKMFYDEKMEALNEKEEEVTIKIAKNLLNNGFAVEDVSVNTGLEVSVVEELAERISKEDTPKETMPV